MGLTRNALHGGYVRRMGQGSTQEEMTILPERHSNQINPSRRSIERLRIWRGPSGPPQTSGGRYRDTAKTGVGVCRINLIQLSDGSGSGFLRPGYVSTRPPSSDVSIL
jgi:hypothetical protein